VTQVNNYFNAVHGIPSNGENPDALYMTDAGIDGSFAPAADDRLLVVGVNHSAPDFGTGKTTYFSHSLQVLSNAAGLLAVSDTWLAGSGLVAAGITDSQDPRYSTYRKLYAFTMSFHCPPGDTLCVTIPQPDGQGGGVPIGTPMALLGRAYLDPATNTRPSKDELLFERVFVMKSPTPARP
jgi:hypothetical protein